jgi:hypothetical protein
MDRAGGVRNWKRSAVNAVFLLAALGLPILDGFDRCVSTPAGQCPVP